MEAGQIIHGDALIELRKLPSDSVDCLPTDPPYGYSFMGKDWDKAVPSVELWRECLRVLKPGAFAFVMSSPRQDVLSQMIMRLDSAGFDCGFTSIYWTYASGFPKAMNIGKAVDKKLGFERETVGLDQNVLAKNPQTNHAQDYQGFADGEIAARITKPASPEAKLLDGAYGGFQPKPAVEVVLVCMKLLSEKTYVDQALRNGHGVTWLDNARIPFQNGADIEFGHHNKADDPQLGKNSMFAIGGVNRSFEGAPEGRFPANLLVSDDVLNDGEEHTGGSIKNGGPRQNNVYGVDCRERGDFEAYGDGGSFSRYFDLDRWFSETIKKLPKEVRGAFPFLITPKASKSERNERLDRLTEASGDFTTCGLNTPEMREQRGRTAKTTKAKNVHPCVKPLSLMSYLITLGSRQGDLVLDPFAGSGTTCLAAKMLGRRFIGIEKEGEYVEICRARVDGLRTLFEFEVPNFASFGGNQKTEAAP